MKRRILSILLALVMALSLLPVTALAYGPFDSVPLNLTVSSYSAPFLSGSTGQHTVNSYKITKYIDRTTAAGTGTNASGSATARFVGSNETGWTLVIDVIVGNYTETWTTNAKITNKDMSEATGSITFGMSWNTQGGVSTTIRISGAKDLPEPDIAYTLYYNGNGGEPQQGRSFAKSPLGSYTFTVKDGTPTNGDKCFMGWADSYNATTAQYQPGDRITLYKENPTKTIYAVWGEHVDSDDDGFCDNDGECLHDHDGDGYCTVEGCTHPHGDNDCCPLKPQPPHAPSENDLPNILSGNIVTVHCTNTAIDPQHADGTYGLLPGGYAVSNVMGDEETGYFCNVTIKLDTYVAEYNKTLSGHTPAEGETDKTIRLRFEGNGDGFRWIPDPAQVTFTVVCETPEPQPPAKPTPGVVQGLLKNAVTVDCTNTEVSHEAKTYDLQSGSYTIGQVEVDATGGYTCTITVTHPEYYVKLYNGVIGVSHTLAPKRQTRTITLHYVPDPNNPDGTVSTWQVKSGVPVTFYVECVSYTLTYDANGGTDGPANVTGLSAQEGYELAQTPAPTHAPQNGVAVVFIGWTAVRDNTIYAAGDTAPTTIETVDIDKDVTVYAVYGLDTDGNGTADVTEVFYKVTFDADGGSAVAPQWVKENLTATEPTNPTKNGYVFDKWLLNGAAYNFSTPVTSNITLVAAWKDDRNGNGIPDEDEYVTVTYTDGVKNKEVFKDQVYNNLLVGDDTPAFDGTPTRPGYRFVGWDPAVTETVTGSVTYTAQWRCSYHPATSAETKPKLNKADHYAYVVGYPDGTVQPQGAITRAEVATIFFRLLSDETRDLYWTKDNAYTDIKAGDWFNNAVSTLSRAGIINGYPDGTFRPNAPITRAEMAKVIAMFAELDKDSEGFKDIAGHWAEAYIKLAAGNGWIAGYPDGTFRPDQYITRAETMTMINRVLERVPSEEEHLLSRRVMLTFPDNQPGDWYYIAVQEATNSHTYERYATEKNGDEQWIKLIDNYDWTKLEF